jgi:PKD repeat protein
MLRTLARAASLALALLAVPAAAHAAAPPLITVMSQATLSSMAGIPAGFEARASDPDGEPVTLTWAFDDGGTATGETASHAWATPGTHTATVTASDPGGLTDTHTFTIQVTPNPNGARPITGPPPGWVPPSLDARPAATLADPALQLSKAGSVPVRIGCQGRRCVGTVTLARAGKRLGKASFSVRAKQTGTAYVRLSRAAAKALRRRASVPVVVSLAVEDAEPLRTTRTLKLRTH